MDDFELELKKDFLDEAVTLLDECEEAFLQLESSGSSKEIWDLIFRLAHNFKGTSRAVGFGEVAEFTHELENLILKLKNNEVSVNDNVVSLLLEVGDQLKIMIEGLRANINATFNQSALIEKIKLAALGQLTGSSTPTVTEVEVEEAMMMEEVPSSNQFVEEEMPMDEAPVVAPAAEMSFQDGDQSYSWEDIEKMLEENNKEIKQQTEAPAVVEPVVAPVVAVEAAPQPEAKKAISVEEESIRVSLSRVEMLNNYVGELVILQSVLMEHKDQNNSEKFKKELSHLGKICKEIQDISMRMRMIPLKNTFSKLNRIIRDTSKTLGKKINLHLGGEETEVDKTILEQLSDPLVHIIRNAADHGVEHADIRTAKGKSPEGNVYIDAYHEGSHLVIEIGDDGAGIYPDRIREKAIAKGVIKATDNLTNQELCELIFHPGFSTKEEVSEISGRGVGMDVVRTNIRKIGGEVNLKSEPEKGSIFKLSLPLTMAIIEGLVVGVAGEKLVIPLSQVHETLQVNDQNLKVVSNLGNCLVLRGEVLPAFRLCDVLKRNSNYERYQSEIALVVRHESFTFAVIVDDIFRQQQVVIKKLGEEYKGQKGFTGSSILGDGKPALILDVIELLSHKVKHSKNSKAQQAA